MLVFLGANYPPVMQNIPVVQYLGKPALMGPGAITPEECARESIDER
jgi:hypothetical protein